jgi:hypothetical protein
VVNTLGLGMAMVVMVAPVSGQDGRKRGLQKLYPRFSILPGETMRLNRDRLSRREQRREQRRENRDVFSRRGSATQYRVQEQRFSMGDDFGIEDSQDQHVFKVDGKLKNLD